MESNRTTCDTKKDFKVIKMNNLKKLRLSLKYRPKIYNLIMKLHYKLREKGKQLAISRKIIKSQGLLKKYANASSQTNDLDFKQNESKESHNIVPWDVNPKKAEKEKSIAEQVTEAAQSALAQSGMVYVESAGMYYDYKTGYYYNSELGLYYHTDTNCYYYYSDEKKELIFHSYPDTSRMPSNEAHEKHERKKAKKHKQEKEAKESSKPKCKKKRNKTDLCVKESESERDTTEKDEAEGIEKDNVELEDGECSGSEVSDAESCLSASTATDDDESVAKHHPPCMRVIVKETKLPKLKVGTLYMITKDGGTVGREGEQHAILLKDQNVSRNHLDIQYDMNKRAYVVQDLGSKNGTILNGNRVSESQVTSLPVEVVHGSTIQLGDTKLLCHIHAGNDTCGHCEPGLIMEAQEKEKTVAYTRTCSVQKQHQLELARLRNKYAPEPLMIEDGSYHDRAKERRETVGSSHESEKTQIADLETSIAPENKGFKMLTKMGWSKGEGLGKDNQGEIEPVPLVNNENKVGLRAAGSADPVTVGSVGKMPLKMTRRTKNLRPPAKLFRDPLEEDDDD